MIFFLERVDDRRGCGQPLDQPAAQPSVADTAEDHRVRVPAHGGDDPPEMRPERPDPLGVDLGVVREAQERGNIEAGPVAGAKDMGELPTVPSGTDDDDLLPTAHRLIVSRDGPRGTGRGSAG